MIVHKWAQHMRPGMGRDRGRKRGGQKVRERAVHPSAYMTDPYQLTHIIGFTVNVDYMN